MKTGKLRKVFGWSLAIFASITTAMIAPNVEAGVSDLGGVAQRVTTSVSAFMELAVSFAFLGGAVLFVAGLFLVYKDTKQPGQNHMKNGVIAIIVGVCLLSMPTLVDVVANTGLSGTTGSTRVTF